MPLDPLDPLTRAATSHWLSYEADVARFVAARNAARLNPRPSLRGRLADLLHGLADRLEPPRAASRQALPR